jgi:hypothetical protein
MMRARAPGHALPLGETWFSGLAGRFLGWSRLLNS